MSAIGRTLYTADPHFPIRIGDATPVPEVRFLGYFLVDGHPTFRYTADGIEIHERIDVTDRELQRRFTIAVSPKPVFFVGETGRIYKSSAGEFKNGALRIAAGKQLDFEVRTKLAVGAEKRLKWVVAKGMTFPKSKTGQSNAVMEFENRSQRTVKIVWVGYDGKLRTYGVVKPGGKRTQSTYANATWLITDEKDKPLGYFISQPLMSLAIIPE